MGEEGEGGRGRGGRGVNFLNLLPACVAYQILIDNTELE